MDDLLNAIGEAWEKVKVRLMEDDGELRRRLKRRWGVLARPPRAWCLAVRASDTRITPTHALITPEWALDVRQCDGGVIADHTVRLDSRLLRRLCRPFRIPFPGLPWTEVAERLGVHCETLRTGMNNGSFDVRRVAGLDGKFAPPIPVLYSERTFDPSSGNGWEANDRLWGTLCRHMVDHMPPTIEQEVKRTAVYRKYGNNRRFRGYAWVCPGCAHTCRTVYYPMPPVLGMNAVKWETAKKEGELARRMKELLRAEEEGACRPLPCFACARCHGVRYFSRVDRASWDQFVAHLSDGLLYGREVKRPADIEAKRKLAFKKRATPARVPEGQKEEVLRRLAAGQSKRMVAEEMNLPYWRVNWHAVRLYKEVGVHTRRELTEKVRIS